MPERIAAPPTREQLHAVIGTSESRILAAPARINALDLYLTLSSGRTRPNRRWKFDLDALTFDVAALAADSDRVTFSGDTGRATALPLGTAAREHAATLSRIARSAQIERFKFGALTVGLSSFGALIHVPADYDLVDPIVVTYHVSSPIAFPRTLLLLERGARATVIVNVEANSGCFIAGTTEICLDEGARLHLASLQCLAGDATAIDSTVARIGKDAQLAAATADFGGALVVRDREFSLDAPGAVLEQATIFFPDADGHLDISSSVRHTAGNTTSQTLVKAAATGHAIARYLGNIAILPHARGSNASLRDDSLLLSRTAHIDSIPALEIACNDVKAYHGATVGAIDDEQIFYLCSRGLSTEEARRTIALGFFETAIDAFPTAPLRESIVERISGMLA